MPRHTIVYLLALCSLAAACSDPPPPPAVGPASTACKPGELACHGNYAGTCDSDGKGWQRAFCGDDKFCAKGTCQEAKCVKGKRSCNGDKVVECPSDGSVESAPTPCDAGKSCVGGTCVAATCKAGEAQCGWNALLTCKNGKFEAAPCYLDEWCDPAKKACQKRTCKPETRQCKTSTSLDECKLDGSAWATTACKSGDGCYSGVCHVQLKDKAPDSPDASAGDASPGATDAVSPDQGTVNTETAGFLDLAKKEVVLEQIDVLKVTFSKTPKPGPDAQELKFTLASANYLTDSLMLQIQGNVGLDSIEIQVAKIEEFEEGEYFTGGEKAAESLIGYNDGSQDRAVKFKWQSADFTIKLAKFEDKNGRVQGTFAATLVDSKDKTKKAYLIDGVFDIERK